MNVPVIISFIKRLKRVQATIEREYKARSHENTRLQRLKRIRRYLMDKLYAQRVPLERYMVQPDLIALPVVTPRQRKPFYKRSGAQWPPRFAD